MTDRFARIPVRVGGMRDLGARDLRVLIAISAHADSEGRAFPSMTRIAVLAAIDRCKVPSSIKRLVAARLITARSDATKAETSPLPSTRSSSTIQGCCL